MTENKKQSYFIGIQGAARNAVLAAADARGQVKAVVRFGPLALHINSDFRRDFHIALTALGTRLHCYSIDELAKHTAGLCVSMSGVREPADADAVTKTLDAVCFTGSFNRLVCEDVWSIIAASGTN